MIRKLFDRQHDSVEVSSLLRRLAETMPLLASLSDEDRARLVELARDFLRRKTVEAAADLTLDQRKQGLLALQAVLPVLNLGLDLYDGWHALVLYPDEFRAPYEHHDPAGVVHEGSRDLSGEAWHRGPVVLAWSHVERDALSAEPDGNVVVHELAHKLDMRNGDVNGMPPLHRDMDPEDWSRTMSAAYADIERHLDGGTEPPIDPYAAHSPGEFFAVVSELFFAWPELLLEAYPEVYRQLSRYFRQDLLTSRSL